VYDVGILLAGLSALMYGAGDFCGGLATRRAPLASVLALSQAAGLLLAIAAALILGQHLPSYRDLLWGIAGGVCGAAGLGALYTAIATTPVAVASPVAAVTGAVIPVLLGVASGERPAILAWVGIGLALPAIVLLSGGRPEPGKERLARRAVLLGTAAGVGFGLFFFAVAHTDHASGLWPLISARCATLTLIAAYALFGRRSLLPPRAGLVPILLSGLLDMGANIAFLLASRVGLLTIAAVVTSLYPGPTVLLAMIVYREKLTMSRAAGLVLAIAGVALISV
jgi:drug/metabolite transporter (DMT)-like permease